MDIKTIVFYISATILSFLLTFSTMISTAKLPIYLGLIILFIGERMDAERILPTNQTKLVFVVTP
jgi:hypothetical protein